MQPDELLFEMIGKIMKPSVVGLTPAERLSSVFTMLPHRAKPGKSVRVGPGSGCVVTDRGAILAADGLIPGEIPDRLDVRGLDRTTANDLFVQALRAPPKRPFLLILFGKKTDILKSLRMTVGQDLLEVCGDKARSIRRRPVMECLEMLGYGGGGDLTPVPAKHWRFCCAGIQGGLRDRLRLIEATEQMAALADKAGDIGIRAIEAAKRGPLIGTAEWDAVSSLLNAAEKRAREKAPGGAWTWGVCE